jgi:Flp pilus assembly pilin Flp
LKKLLVRFAANESGGVAIDYGLIVVVISVAIIATVFEIGGKLSVNFTTIAAMLP